MANLNTAAAVRDEGNWRQAAWAARLTSEDAMNAFVSGLLTQANEEMTLRVGNAWKASHVGMEPWGSVLKRIEMHLAQARLLEAAAGLASSALDSDPSPFLGTSGDLLAVAAARREAAAELVRLTKTSDSEVVPGWEPPEVYNVRAPEFGAVGDGVAYDDAALAAAVTAALNAPAGRGEIFLPRGDYRIASTWIVALLNGAGTDYDFVGPLRIRGEAGYDVNGCGARIICDFKDKPAIAIQFGRGIEIRDLVINGGMAQSPLVVGDLIDNTKFNTNGARDNRYSPHCAIAIDPFSGHASVTGANAGNQYPGLGSYYVGAVAHGSSHTVIENCTFGQFACGVMLSPVPPHVNGEEVVISRTIFQWCVVGLGLGQDQLRGVSLVDCYFKWCQFMLHGRKYGAQTGVMPNIFGGYANACKYLFGNPNPSRGGASVSGFYAEAFLSLGFLCGAVHEQLPIVFTGCGFNLYGTSPRIDTQGVIYGPTHFDGCGFSYASAGPVFLHTHYRPVRFTACQGIGSENAGDPADNWVLSDWSYAVMEECELSNGTSSNTPFSRRLTVPAIADLNSKRVHPGALIQAMSGGSLTSVKPEHPRVQVLAPAGARVLDGLGGCTFTAGVAGLLQVGDIIVSLNVLRETEMFDLTLGSLAPYGYYGRVSAVAGAAITLDRVCVNASTTDALGLSWIPRLHTATTGDTHSNTTVDNVSNPGAWAVGDRVRGAGITDGTFITAIVGTTFTISKAASATAAGVRLFDADLSVVTGTPV